MVDRDEAVSYSNNNKNKMIPRDRLTTLRSAHPYKNNNGGTLIKVVLFTSFGTLLFVVGIFTAVRTTTRAQWYDERQDSRNNGDRRNVEEEAQLASHSNRRKRTDLSTSVYIYDPKKREEDVQVDDFVANRKGINHAAVSSNKKRIAILIPFVSSMDMAQSLPTYFSAFAAAAGGSADLVDFLIIHDGIPSHLLPPVSLLPSNVKLISVGSTRRMAQLFLRCLDQQTDVSKQIQRSLVKIIGDLLHKYPYLLVEYKPALGHIFQDYIQGYTHWGYSDLDILFGDLPRWITQEELDDFDIVTYGFGDQGRIYLRGQFTFHKNMPNTINQLWRGCKYLSAMHDRFFKAQTGEKSLKLESAEGCYSAAVLKHNDIKIKYAVKAFTDVTSMDYITDSSLPGDQRYEHGVYHGIGSDGTKSVIYKAGANSASSFVESTKNYAATMEDKQNKERIPLSPGQMLVTLPLNWFEMHHVYSDPKIALQREVGDMTPIQTLRQKEGPKVDANCMYWAPKTYQKFICAAPDEVASSDTVFWINGKLYKQRHETTPFFDGTILTFPFFHFQEWKRTYRSASLYPMKYPSTALGWVLTKEGAIPVYPPVLSDDSIHHAGDSNNLPAMRAGSTHYHGHGGVVQSHIISNWIQAEDVDRTFLPSSNHVYCLKSSRRQFPENPEVAQCDDAVSWQDTNNVILFNDAQSWNTVNYGDDVTLLLTLQLSLNPITDSRQPLAVDALLSNMLELAERNILSWDNSISGRKQPCVLIIHVAGATEEAAHLIHERFGVTSEIIIDGKAIKNRNRRTTTTQQQKQQQHNINLLSHCLIAAIFSADSEQVSRKALLNMAADAAPTRWIVTGLEVERALVISKEASFFAQRATKVQGDVPGKLFLIPQFSAHSNILSHQTSNNAAAAAAHVLPAVGLSELLRARENIKLTWDISSLDCVPCAADADGNKAEENLLRMIETLWWEMTLARVTHGRNNVEQLEETAWIETADNIEYALIEFLLPDNQDKLEAFGITPLLMIDRIGPRKHMLTLNVARGVEEFGGNKCFNGLVLTQLSTLGYDIRVLPGAFAISLPAWRDQTVLGGNCKEKRKTMEENDEMCNGCFMISENIKNSIAYEERARVAKAALLWREMDTHKMKNKL